MGALQTLAHRLPQEQASSETGIWDSYTEPISKHGNAIYLTGVYS